MNPLLDFLIGFLPILFIAVFVAGCLWLTSRPTKEVLELDTNVPSTFEEWEKANARYIHPKDHIDWVRFAWEDGRKAERKIQRRKRK